MSVLQPPNSHGRTYRYQIFGIMFDHVNGYVQVDCVDPTETATGVAKNTRFDIDGRLNPEVREKVEALLSAANDLACAAEDALP